MSDPDKLPDMLLSWMANGEDPEEIHMRIRWFEGSIGAGIFLFLREAF